MLKRHWCDKRIASSHLRVTTHVISHITLAEQKGLVTMNPDSATIVSDCILQKPVVVNPRIPKALVSVPPLKRTLHRAPWKRQMDFLCQILRTITSVKAAFFFRALSRISLDL